MKPSVFVTLFLLTLVSCKKIAKEDLQGEWFCLDIGKEDAFKALLFNGKSIKLQSSFMYTEVGEYNVNVDELTIRLDRDSTVLKTKIEKIWKDSLVLFNGRKYYKRIDGYGVNLCEWDDYRLINITTNKLLSKEIERKDNFSIVHFYKKNSETKIRFNGRFIDYKDLGNINYACTGGAPNHYKTLIYLDRNITLKELKKFYYYLNSTPIWIATKRSGITDMYLLKDVTEIFIKDYRESMVKIDEELLPPPPLVKEFSSIGEYINGGWGVIKINTVKEFYKVNKITVSKPYLIVINPDLSLKNYIEFQIILNKKRERRTITSILD